MNNTERQYQAGLLRQRVREKRLAEAEEQSRGGATGEELPGDFRRLNAAAPSKEKHFKVNTLEAGLGALFGAILDMLESLGALTAVIPVVGLAIAGASAVFFMVVSGILAVSIALWLFMVKGISPFSKDGRTIYIVLFLSALGNGVFSWLPVWVGFFLWLYVRSYKRGIFKLAGAKF